MFVRAWRGRTCTSARLQETRADKPVHLDLSPYVQPAQHSHGQPPRRAEGPMCSVTNKKIKHGCSSRIFKLLITADWTRSTYTSYTPRLRTSIVFLLCAICSAAVMNIFSDISNKTSCFLKVFNIVLRTQLSDLKGQVMATHWWWPAEVPFSERLERTQGEGDGFYL